MAEIAHMLHWQVGDLMEMDVDELLAWHEEVRKLNDNMRKSAP